MVNFFLKAITSTVTKTVGHVIRQSLKNSNKKSSSNTRIDDKWINDSIESAIEITKEADYYLKWLEDGIDEILERQAELSKFSTFQLNYDFPEIEYPILLNLFPSKPIEEEIVKINSLRKFLGRFMSPIKTLNERTLNKKKNVYSTLLQEFNEKEATLNSKRAQFENEYFAKKEKYDRDFNFTVSQIENIKNELKSLGKSDYTPFIKLILTQTRITFGQTPELSDLSYDFEGKSLIAEFLLPNPDQLPKVKSARYLKTYGTIRETEFSEAQLKRNYYKFLEKLTINLCYKLFLTDDLNALEKINLKFVPSNSGDSYVEAIITNLINITEWKYKRNLSIIDSFKVFKIRKREIGLNNF